MDEPRASSSGVELAEDLRRLRVEVRGAVQGVGFRPFVYRLANDLNLAGWVLNDTVGVHIEVEGPGASLRRFLDRLPAERPPRAIIHALEHDWLAPAGLERFEIRHSDEHGAKTALILPDIATCPDCLAEVRDPANRRFRYPFTNCTNCGPRLTIIQALPYDRPNTTMRRFTLCPACRREYEDPRDRRFHAQPNACPECGPDLELWTTDPLGNSLGPATDGRWSVVAAHGAALSAAAEALREGQIVAVKGLGGFHLMVDARSPGAVARLRARKRREEKPFALMVRDVEEARRLCEVSPEEEALLASPEAPIVLLRRREAVAAEAAARTAENAVDAYGQASAEPPFRLTSSSASSAAKNPAAGAAGHRAVAEDVAPGNPYLGVMLPYTPLHHLLLAEVDFPLVATSGNLTDEPICTDEREAVERLGPIADRFLVHDRPIERHVDDSVAAMVAGEPRLLRRARGYAPLPVSLAREAPCVLAVGAHLKNTVALSVGRQVFVSQHVGDLETPQAIGAFERVIADFLRLYDARPVAVAHDMHPDYVSTRFARALERGAWSVEMCDSHAPRSTIHAPIAVQHHHAHLASCLAENSVEGPALGVTWDGTGYGTDGAIWGGEFLLGDAAGFERIAHLRTFRLPGGETAVREPARVALALLWELEGAACLDRTDLSALQGFTPADRAVLGRMLERGLNSPVTSSAGRLFDAVAALIGLRRRVSFEGQAAMMLEWAADVAEGGAYPIDIERSTSDVRRPTLVLDWRPLVEAALADMRRRTEPATIAARFHNGLAAAIVAVAREVGEPRVALTGGCFLNRLLVEQSSRQLREAGFEVLLHRQVPPGDGGISLGQVAVAAAHIERGGGPCASAFPER